MNGNAYAPTYLRRAKGLVKAGRARWSDENKICLLASPAHINEEAHEMDIYDNDGNVAKTANIPETVRESLNEYVSDKKEDANAAGPEMTPAYILSQMEKIRADNAYIYEALMSVREIKPHAPSMNAADYASQGKAEAIGDTVKAREATNLKLLSMYERMYADHFSNKKTDAIDEAKLNTLREIMDKLIENDAAETFAPSLNEVFKNIFK